MSETPNHLPNTKWRYYPYCQLVMYVNYCGQRCPCLNYRRLRRPTWLLNT